MTIQTRLVDYESGGHTFEGILAWDDADRRSWKATGNFLAELFGN